MHSLLAQLVAVASSLVLVLPPGLCCGSMQAESAEAVAAPKSCCQRAADVPPAQQPTPTSPRIECCCERDLTLPEKSVKPADMTVLALPLLIDDADLRLDTAARGEAIEAPFRPGPRLHVVKCVWLC